MGKPVIGFIGLSLMGGIKEGAVLIDFGTSIPASTRNISTGHTTKLINNSTGMTTVCTMSQAFTLAKRARVYDQQFFDIMSTAPPNSPFMQFWNQTFLQ